MGVSFFPASREDVFWASTDEGSVSPRIVIEAPSPPNAVLGSDGEVRLEEGALAGGGYKDGDVCGSTTDRSLDENFSRTGLLSSSGGGGQRVLGR